MKKKLVLAVGNEMMGDDAAGPLLARMIERSPLDEWDVLDGGNVPENSIFKIREMVLEEVVIVDAADMNLQSGEIRLIDKEQVGGVFFMTTHSLPLIYLMDSIQEFVPRVELIGIQPEVVAFGYPVSLQVKQAVEHVYAWLGQSSRDDDDMVTIMEMEPGLEGGTNESDCSAQDHIRQGGRSL